MSNKEFSLYEHKETITSTNTLITNPLVNQKEPIMNDKIKLYTEEQVMKFINDNFDEGCSELVGLTPIELPTDEEIENASNKFAYGSRDLGIVHNAFQVAAKWMRYKIKGGQDE